MRVTRFWKRCVRAHRAKRKKKKMRAGYKRKHKRKKKMNDRRSVQTNFRITPKDVAVNVSTGSDRECRLASISQIPYDYVPPPENLILTTVPYKWPSDQEWSRMPDW